MAKYVEFISNFDNYKQILQFKQQFKTKIINNGLDEPLHSSLQELKSNLKFAINEDIRILTDRQIATTSESKNNLLGQTLVNPPKSEQEIIHYLTGGKTDLSKYNKAKDYSTLEESGVIFGHRNRGQEGANRVTLRLEIGPDETVEQQYQKAKQFFQTAIFAFPDAVGRTSYYMNPGIDISEDLKIKCSTQTGFGDEEPIKGMSPARRFQKDAQNKGYAEWTLRQEAVTKIRNSFLNISDVVNLIKEGDYDRAQKVLLTQARKNKIRETTQINDLVEKLDTLKENKQAAPTSMQAYTNTIDLINNLNINKSIKDDQVIYTLVSDFNDTAGDTDVTGMINRAIRNWITLNEESWFAHLVQLTEKLITKFTSQFSSTAAKG